MNSFCCSNINLLSSGSKQTEAISTVPSMTNINKSVENTSKGAVSKRKRRDRIPERPNFRLIFHSLRNKIKLLKSLFIFSVLIYGV